MSPSALSALVQSALQGQHEFEGQPMEWKTTLEKDHCKYQVGTILLPQVQKDKTKEIWKIWLENTERRQFLSDRNNDLNIFKETMEKQVQEMTREKVAADLSLIQKFKELLNAKKRKIRLLTVKLQKRRVESEAEGEALEEEEEDKQKEDQSEQTPTRKRRVPSSDPAAEPSKSTKRKAIQKKPSATSQNSGTLTTVLAPSRTRKSSRLDTSDSEDTGDKERVASSASNESRDNDDEIPVEAPQRREPEQKSADDNLDGAEDIAGSRRRKIVSAKCIKKEETKP
ncbi:hypothetical protein EC973_002299 [Apophysomyces ossiformis]|uniref:Uncharacterized protein n=1 Tax=Apophysomyces ossiformis TaxID=679940 RepID=A0A8H7BSM7_9FUNG|nr:hypothetical protein EC973_002299 [Apophysomyces ossiformis]